MRLRPLKEPFGIASDRVRHSCSSLHPDAAPPARSTEQQHYGTAQRRYHFCTVGGRVRPQLRQQAPGRGSDRTETFS